MPKGYVYLITSSSALANHLDQIAALETALRVNREKAQTAINNARERINAVNKKDAELSTTITTLQHEVEAITAERDALQSTSTAESNLSTDQLDSLRSANAALEKALEEERQKLNALANRPAGDEKLVCTIRCYFFVQLTLLGRLLSRSSTEPWWQNVIRC